MNYLESIEANLELIDVIALFHPRLALLALDSEVELVLKEILPPLDLFSMNFDYDDVGRDYSFQRRAVRYQIGRFDNAFPSGLVGVLDELRKLANKCRHSRFRLPDANFASAFIDRVRSAIRSLATEETFAPINAFAPRCRSCEANGTTRSNDWRDESEFARYSLREVFHSLLGTTFPIHCFWCYDEIARITIPDANETTCWQEKATEIELRLRSSIASSTG